MSGPATLALPPRLDLTSAAGLAEELRARLGEDLALDAAGVTHLGTPGLQVLLAARKSWEATGAALSVVSAPAALEEQLAQFGLGLAALSTGPAGAPEEESA